MHEYDILEHGVFDDERYFDVQVEYAKHTPDDIVMRVTVENRADQAAPIDVLPQIWARNKWSWKGLKDKPSLVRNGSEHVELHVTGRQQGRAPIVVTASAKEGNAAQHVTWL